MKSLALLLALIALPAFGTIYEWKDPGTGKLKAGDKPPQGVEYWIEGQKPNKTDNSKEPICIGIGCSYAEAPREATGQEISRCLSLIKKTTNYKDPDSVKTEGTSTFVMMKDGSQQVTLAVNAKNSYGAYAGAKPAYCKYRKDGSVISAGVY